MELNEEEINESEELIRLAKVRLKKRREKEVAEASEKEEENNIDQSIANMALISLIGIVLYKIMTGTF
ncbi:hypothetical protein PVJ1_00038 [Psychrobacillus phage PVJ1]|nr:hypothetical protein PVJ1_00038 [Psychrobacillus phage PVJ1]